MKSARRFLISIIILLSTSNFLFANEEQNAFSFSFPNSVGGEINLQEHKGKTLMLFVASTDCGFATQYKDFEKIYKEYESNNFLVIGISAIDLNVKEPRRGSDINKYCSDRFGTTYPISNVIEVNLRSKNTHPFFNWAKSQGIEFKKNFEKILIDKNGNIVQKFKRDRRPTNKKIKNEIENII